MLGLNYNQAEAMEFDFQPLSSLCRIEVNLATGFGSGTIRGTFGKMGGSIDFYPENPSLSNGKILLSSRSLRFGHAKVAYDAHATDWMDSSSHPEIIFDLVRLSSFSWHGKELRADAEGILDLKGNRSRIKIPLSVRYFRGERRKFEGKTGDLLRLEGLLTLQRSEFGLAAGILRNEIMEDIVVRISITGASNEIRPFLPSRLFRR